ncbi:hypothetical protein KKC16_02145 [Patescibacteria group bacterium]|nr:hypothetical protein [Patescibacteria group bacterium]
MKKNYLIIFILLFVLVISGCAKKVDTNNINQNQQQAQENNQPQWNENFDEASLDDLLVGGQAMIMGTENSDNSISANQIMIGNTASDFQNMNQMRRPTSTAEINNNQLQPSAGFNGQRPNFQNMSDEERAKMREQMVVGGGTAGGGRVRSGNMGGGATRLVGEILDKDESTITLKLKDGGSKLIFFSEDTNVSIVKSTY